MTPMDSTYLTKITDFYIEQGTQGLKTTGFGSEKEHFRKLLELFETTNVFSQSLNKMILAYESAAEKFKAEYAGSEKINAVPEIYEMCSELRNITQKISRIENSRNNTTYPLTSQILNDLIEGCNLSVKALIAKYFSQEK